MVEFQETPSGVVVDADHLVSCPWCGRRVATYLHPGMGVRQMEGHRREHAPDSPWCQGGGRCPS